MKITVNPVPLVTATLDVALFRKLFAPAFDLEAAVRGSVRVLEGRAPPDEVMAFIYHGMDWSNFLLLWKALPPRITLRVYSVRLEGFTVHRPGVIDPVAHTFETEDHVIDKTDFLVVHTGNQRLDKHLAYLMAQNLINYGQYEWAILFDRAPDAD